MSNFNKYMEMAKKSKGPDYSEVAYKIDKYMPDDEYVQDEYWKAIENKDVEGVSDLLSEVADDRMYHYMPKGGNIEGLAKYLVKSGG